MATMIPSRLVLTVLCGVLLGACDRTSPRPPPQVSIISSLAGLGIAVHDPEQRLLALYAVGPDDQITSCLRWRLEGPEHQPVPEPCTATTPPPPARKTVP
jgi:hypothetical protein